MGRRKIKIEKVEDTNTKQVTFSKRRSGLFKKASELATLCNAEVGIVVFSPGNKPYSFGKPNFDVVANRFKRDFEESDNNSESSSRSTRSKLDPEISTRFNSIVEATDAEKKNGEKLRLLFEAGGDKRFMKPDEEFTIEELKKLKAKLESKLCAIEDNLNQILGLNFLMLLSKGEGLENNV